MCKNAGYSHDCAAVGGKHAREEGLERVEMGESIYAEGPGRYKRYVRAKT